MEERIEKLMKTLGCTREEAEDIIATDSLIDKGKATPYDLKDEKAKVAKQMSKISAKSTAPKEPTKRGTGKPENELKVAIIAELYQFLKENEEISCDKCKISNKTRQIAFNVGEKSFELTLVEKRQPKKK